jgi:hypothetical protein
MGVAAAFFGEIVSITAYVLLVAGVFKLFQVVTLLGEIKELLGRRPASEGTSFSPASLPLADLQSSDEASEYAARLLRAVNTESHSTTDVSVSDSH